MTRRFITPAQKGKIKIEAYQDIFNNVTVKTSGETNELAGLLFALGNASPKMRNAIMDANRALIQVEINKRKDELYIEKCKRIINQRKPNDD